MLSHWKPTSQCLGDEMIKELEDKLGGIITNNLGAVSIYNKLAGGYSILYVGSEDECDAFILGMYVALFNPHQTF